MPNKDQKIRVRPSEVDYFTSNLATLLSAGVSAGQALDSLRETTKSKSLSRALQLIAQEIDDGFTLSDALTRHKFVSNNTLALIRLGEVSGQLVPNLKLAAKQEKKTREMKSKIKTALLYPAIVMGLSVVIGLAVGYFLLPRLADTFDSLDVKLPLISRVMLGVGEFLHVYGHIFIPALFIVSGAAIYVLFVWSKTKYIGQHILMYIPGIGRLLREAEIARFGYLLGTLLGAGLTIREASKSLIDSTTSIQYGKVYAKLGQQLDEGYSFKTAFLASPEYKKDIPVTVQQMIIAGEQSGSLPDTLQNVGETYQEKANNTTANLEAIIEPILLVVVWMGVMLVAVSVIVPIYSLLGGLDA